MDVPTGLQMIDPEALALDAPEPDPAAEPEGFLVEVGSGERIHFLDWGDSGDRGVLLVHGLGGTAWGWTGVARRLRRHVRTVAMDLRGHGLSDAPTHGYDGETLAGDVVAVADGAGVVSGLVLAGHGFGAMVAAWAAEALGERCAGLVLVDGGWQDVAGDTGMTAAEWLRDLAEPPEVLASTEAYLADRRSWDPASWTPDEEIAARATVVEVPAGKVVAAVRPHALEGSVGAMFTYRPTEVLPKLDAPIVAAVAGAAWSGEAAEDGAAAADPMSSLATIDASRRAAGRSRITVVRFPSDGHNLPRYRPRELAGLILRLASA